MDSWQDLSGTTPQGEPFTLGSYSGPHQTIVDQAIVQCKNGDVAQGLQTLRQAGFSMQTDSVNTPQTVNQSVGGPGIRKT